MATVELRPVPIGALVANRDNVREHLEGIDELAASIRALGVLQPLIANDRGGQLVVTDGHRRLVAARRAQVPAVMCLVTADADDRQVTVTMLAAALHKQLRPIEQARAFDALQRDGMPACDIARATGYSAALIRGRLLLLELPKEAQDLVDDERLTLEQAMELAKQVRSRGAGSVTAGKSVHRSRSSRRGHFLPSHPLVRAVERDCTHREDAVVLGGAGCGACWERAIRQDERGEINLTSAFDEAVVQRVLSGERPATSVGDREESVRRLLARGWSDLRIAAQIGTTDRTVLRIRQRLNLAPVSAAGSTALVRSAQVAL